jgi:hypothetical protein
MLAPEQQKALQWARRSQQLRERAKTAPLPERVALLRRAHVCWMLAEKWIAGESVPHKRRI